MVRMYVKYGWVRFEGIGFLRHGKGGVLRLRGAALPSAARGYGQDWLAGGSFGFARLRFLRLRSGRAGQAAGGSRERGKGREGDYSFDSF